MRRIAPLVFVSSLLVAACAGGEEAGSTTSTLPIAVTTTRAPVTTTVTVRPPSTTSSLPATSFGPLPTPDQGSWDLWAKTNFIQPSGVAAAPDGAVWTITDGGLVRWDPDGTYAELRDPEWPDPSPRSIMFTPDGDLWAGFHIHVFRIDAEGSTRFEFAPRDPNWGSIELAAGPDGEVWAASNQLGVQRFEGDRWLVVNNVLPGRGGLDTFSVDADGRAWVGSYWDGLWVLEQGRWRQEHSWTTRLIRAAANGDLWYVVDSGQAEDTTVVHRNAGGDTTEYAMDATSVWEIAQTGDGAYVGTNPRPRDAPASHGLWYLTGGDIEAVPGAWDAIGRQILGVAVDGGGDVWLGGQGGLWRYDGVSGHNYLTDTVAGFSIGYVIARSDGLVWAGDCRESSVRRDGTWHRLPEAPEELSVCDAVIDANGVQWLAGDAGIARLDGAQWVVDGTDATGTPWTDRYPECASEVCDEPHWAVAATRADVWAGIVGVEDGLWRHGDGTWEHVVGALPAGSGGVVDLAAGADGSLWVATDHGVHRLTAGSWIHYPSGKDGPPDLLRAIGVGRGTVWTDTYDESARFDGTEWTRYPHPEWFDSAVLVVDADGAVWRNTPDGPRRFDGTSTDELDLPFVGEGHITAITISDDGSWWIAGAGYLYRWTP